MNALRSAAGVGVSLVEINNVLPHLTSVAGLT